MHRKFPDYIASAINSPISIDNFPQIGVVSRKLRCEYQYIHPQHQYLDNVKEMAPSELSRTLSDYRKPTQPSAVTWELQFDKDGRNIEARSTQWSSPFNPEAQVVWRLSICLRGPLIIFLELTKEIDGSWKISHPESEKIQNLANAIANTTHLSPVSGAYLSSISIDPKLLREPIYLRMDYTDEPNAYQLLVEE